MFKNLLYIIIIIAYSVFSPYISEARRSKDSRASAITPYAYEIRFNKANHTYTVNGEKYPSVHAILNLLDKPALIPWAIKTVITYLAENNITPNPKDSYRYYQEALRERDRAATTGTETHSFISQALSGQKHASSSQDTAPYVSLADRGGFQAAFAKWFNEAQPTLVASEAVVISPTYKYAGTIDALCLIQGELWLVDFKTSPKIYDDHILQIAAYRQAIEEMGGYWVLSGDKYVFHSLEGKRIAHTGIVRLDKSSGEVEFKKLTEEEYSVAVNKFLLLSKYYNLHNPEDVSRFGVVAPSGLEDKATATNIFDNLLGLVIQAMRDCGTTEEEISRYIAEEPYFFFLPEVRAILPNAIMALKNYGIGSFSEQWKVFKEIIDNTRHRDVKYSATFLEVLTDRLIKGEKLEDILRDFKDMWHFGFVWATRFSKKSWDSLITNRKYLEEKIQQGLPITYPNPLAIQIYPVSDFNGAFNSDLETSALIDHGYFVLYYEVDNLFELLTALVDSTDPQNGVKASIICLNGHGNPQEVGEYIADLSDFRLLEKFGVKECLEEGGSIILYSCDTGINGGIVSALFNLFRQANYIYAPTGRPTGLKIQFDINGGIIEVEYEGSEVYDLFKEPIYQKPTAEDIQREIRLYYGLLGIDFRKINIPQLVSEIQREIELQFYMLGYIIFSDYLSLIYQTCDKYK
ncbi:MAG: hypothetical protein NC818_02705 [Candidatus Omnitrophica bacterium]|nr:hypothetical protein [Candidatus Omnitrophota bacterium]